jgi:hypothetical protein
VRIFFIFLFKAKAEPYGSASVCRKTAIVIKKWVFSVACSAGFASLQSQLFVPLHDATTLMADEAVTQSPQSVLIGIENSLYLIKNRLFLQAKAEPHGSASYFY